ncbi:hypothetical protein ACIBSW_21570 [Actinoplanes sp. NPDC049668]|uniref:hypothetical protein n=1 Tax=unclassified Actinoplanes TaxID=2626549 RepID=UPI0033A6C3BD
MSDNPNLLVAYIAFIARVSRTVLANENASTGPLEMSIWVYSGDGYSLANGSGRGPVAKSLSGWGSLIFRFPVPINFETASWCRPNFELALDLIR